MGVGTGERRVGWIAAALVVAVAVAYLPALDGQFLGWDDDLYVSENPHLRGGLSLATVRAVFTTVHTGNWIPLTWLSHATDLTLFGLEPRGHHVTALLLHLLNTVLLFALLYRTTGARWPSAGVAALFGLHPIHVESVAWISERKDVLSTALWLSTTLLYVRWVRQPSASRWWPVLVTLALGLLAKPMLMTLPFTLLLLDWWPLRRASWNAVREKASLFVVALGLGGVAFVAQRAAGAMELADLVGPLDRLANAVVSYVRYLGLTVWPVGLSPWYSHPAIEGPPLTTVEIVGAALTLTVLTVAAFVARRRRPYLLVGWLWYVGTLLPVIGLVHFGAHGMADRYTYVPLIGIFIAVAFALAELPIWQVGWTRAGAAALAVAALVALGVGTWRQCHVWHDSVTFWEYTLTRNPRSAVAHYGLANIHAADRRLPEAMRHYREAATLRPDPWRWHVELAELALRVGDRDTAREAYGRAIVRRPNDAILHASLGTVLMQQREDPAARRHLERAVALDPDLAKAWNHLGIVLERGGDRVGAARAFRTALELDPGMVSARASLNMLEGDGPLE